MKKVRYDRTKEGQVFQFGEFNWIKLQASLCIMQDVAEHRTFEGKTSNWASSGLREYLNGAFLEKLVKRGAKVSDFILTKTSLTADDGLRDYGKTKDTITLLTAGLYRANRHLLTPIEETWWLATPYSCKHPGCYSVRCVNVLGQLIESAVHTQERGVRPACKLNPETEVHIV